MHWWAHSHIATSLLPSYPVSSTAWLWALDFANNTAIHLKWCQVLGRQKSTRPIFCPHGIHDPVRKAQVQRPRCGNEITQRQSHVQSSRTGTEKMVVAQGRQCQGWVACCQGGGTWDLPGWGTRVLCWGDMEYPMFFPNGMHILGRSWDKTLHSQVINPLTGLAKLNTQGFSHFTESEREYVPFYRQWSSVVISPFISQLKPDGLTWKPLSEHADDCVFLLFFCFLRIRHNHSCSFIPDELHCSWFTRKEKKIIITPPIDPSNKKFIKFCIYTMSLVISTYVVKIINKWNCDYSHYFPQGYKMN